MANIKISELSSSLSLTGTEIIPLVQSGSTVKTTAQAIANLATSVTSASFAISSSRAQNATSASFATTTTSASYALTASYAMNGGGGGGGVSYTSYVAKISGDSPITSSVFENTTGLTFTWASGSSYAPAFSYTTTISSVDPTKIAVFLAGEFILFDEKGITVVYPKPAYKITTVNSTTATLDIFYDTGYSSTPVGTPITVEVRIYP